MDDDEYSEPWERRHKIGLALLAVWVVAGSAVALWLTFGPLS